MTSRTLRDSPTAAEPSTPSPASPYGRGAAAGGASGSRGARRHLSEPELFAAYGMRVRTLTDILAEAEERLVERMRERS
jgi:hypothetical protein